MELFASHCVFPTPDIRRTADYYQHMLGFRRVDYLDAKEQHICLYRDGVEFILTQSNGQKVIPNHVLYGYGGDAYVIVKDQTALQNEYEEKGVNIIQRLHKTDYHNQEFVIEDIDGRFWTSDSRIGGPWSGSADARRCERVRIQPCYVNSESVHPYQ